MKRFVSLILALCLLAGLAACGTTAANTTTDEPAAPSASEPAPAENDAADASVDASILAPEDTALPSDEITELDEGTDADTIPETDTPQDGESEQTSITPEETGAPTQAESPQPAESETQPEQTPPPQEQAPVQAPQEPEQKILIAYFTWADNTQVDDPSSVDPTIDAPSSASILPPGDTARIAGWIQQEVGGDLHSIITADAYSSDYDECLDRAIEEHDNGTRPALSSSASNMADYDIVFLGYPIWWYTSPMVVRSFLEAYDFSGKTIVPFCTTMGAGVSQSVEEIRELCPEATVLDGLALRTGRADDMPDSIAGWLEMLEIL